MKRNILFSRYLLLIIISFSTIFIGKSQSQIGNDIDGEAAGDQSGYSISMPFRNFIAIGASNNDGGGNGSGHVRLYSYRNAGWLQKGGDIDGEASVDLFGTSVSMPDSNIVAIGAHYNDGGGINAGHLRIYKWNGTSWLQRGNDIDGEAAGDRSGVSVSMGDSITVAVGAYLNDGNGIDAGHARIYKWNGTSWLQKGNDIDGEFAGDNFGRYVSMPDDNTVAIGAYLNDGSGVDAGHVRIYKWSGNTWNQKGGDIDGEMPGDKSGNAISMPDSNVVAIGARYNSGNGTEAGHVRVYKWNGSTWVQKGGDIDGELAGDRFGTSVSMADSNSLVVGAYQNDGSGVDAGHVRIYEWDGNTWLQKGKDVEGEAANDGLGISVSMPDPEYFAAGAFYNDGNGVQSGHVRVYSVCYTTGNVNHEACKRYVSPSGNYVWTNSGIYADTLKSSGFCDSIITINLIIDTVDISILREPSYITAQAVNASYQWLDCNNGMTILQGDTNQSFTPVANGSYAVQVIQNGCVDTSACIIINNVGLNESDYKNGVLMYPNPTGGQITIDLGEIFRNAEVIIRNVIGQKVSSHDFENIDKLEVFVPGEKGIYFLEVNADNKRTVVKVIKE